MVRLLHVARARPPHPASRRSTAPPHRQRWGSPLTAVQNPPCPPSVAVTVGLLPRLPGAEAVAGTPHLLVVTEWGRRASPGGRRPPPCSFHRWLSRRRRAPASSSGTTSRSCGCSTSRLPTSSARCSRECLSPSHVSRKKSRTSSRRGAHCTAPSRISATAAGSPQRLRR